MSDDSCCQCHDCGDPFDGETHDIKENDGSIYTVCDWCYRENYAEEEEDDEFEGDE